MRLLQRLSAVGAVALVLAGAAFARLDDKDSEAARARALALLTSFHKLDWKGLYSLVLFSPKVKATITDADSFARDFAKGIRGTDADDKAKAFFESMSGLAVGRPIIEKGVAYVPTTYKLAIDGHSITMIGIARMVKVDGVWNWDLAFSDDTQKASEQRTTELLGQPALGGQPSP